MKNGYGTSVLTVNRKQRKTKPTAKNTAGRGTNATPKKPNVERDSLKKLRGHVDEIEQRLSNAQSLARISVQALDSSFQNLNQIHEHSTDKRTLRLAEHVDAVSNELNEKIEQTRTDIAHDLKMVLDDPRLETISNALTKANQRLSRTEAEQVKIINKTSRQISEFTTSVETALEAALASETQARQTALTNLGGRLDELESHSAKAMTRIGDKVVDVSENLKQDAQLLRQELGEKGLGLTQDLEEHKSDMAMRIEALEDDQRNTIPSLERRLVTLDTRLEMLENAKPIAPIDDAKSETSAAPPPQNEPDYEAAPHIENKAWAQQTAAPRLVQTDAFSPSDAVRLQTVTPPDNPYDLSGLEQTKSPALGAAQSGSFTPQEFKPEAYNPDEHPAEAHNQNPPTQPAEPSTLSAPEHTPSHAPFNLDAGAFEQIDKTNIAPPPFAPEIPISDIQPVFESMSDARPAVDILPTKTPKKSSRFKGLLSGKKPKKESRTISMPIKTTAMMVGVATLGLFAAKTVLPKFIGGNAAAPEASNSQTQQTNSTSRAQTPPIQTVAAIGDYSDTMKAPDLGSEQNGRPSAQALTLESAAINGEAIAQFQLGLSHLEAGRNEDAVRLIRLAANQNQPAAQYRLGKLYEAGVGVKADPATAMGLLAKAANGGNRIAMHDLGHYYATGITGISDMNQAMNWFREAAGRGVLDSQFNLGVLYQGGNGVDKNISESYIWYAIAGKQGDKVAAQRSQLVAKDLTQQQLATARARIKAFNPKAINDAANGVFKDLPWLTKARGKPDHIAANNKMGVKTAQNLLSTLGYDVGIPDGDMGPRTRNAVISFERANNLPETGRVNAALLDRLNLAAGA
ncbi:MAG: SEL1-like repeat protein [Robiginitomaculum sp.]|nr:SEL1-like repeat protein [Robiginitomaculum sp.]